MERDPETVEGQYDVFVRKARNAARQCLFFLYDLRELGHYPRNAALDADAAFALRQTRSLVDSVHIPTRIVNAARAGQLEDIPAATEVKRRGFQRVTDFLIERDGEPKALFDLSFRLIGERSRGDRLSDFVHNRDDGANAHIQAEAREAILGFWAQRIWARLHSIEGALDDQQARQLILQFQAFLRISRPRGPIEYYTMLVQKLGALTVRNIALVVGFAALTAVWMQEVLASLVLNGGWHSLWPFVLVLCAGGIAVLFGLFANLRLGKSAFARLAFPAEEPERGIQSWPERSAIRRLIGRSEITKALLMAGWMALWIVGFWLKADPTQRTLCLLASLSWCVLIALHWLDLWDFIDPRPIRFLVLLGLVMLAAGVFTGWHREAGYVLFGCVLAVWTFNSIRKRFASTVSVLMALLCVAILALIYVGDRTLDQTTWPKQRIGALATRGVAPDGTMQRVAADEWPFPSRDSTGNPAPIVLIAASGGGSRAAIYTALTLEALHASSDLADVAASVQAISSVSGGSLATAAYVAERIRREQRRTPLQAPWKKLVDDVSKDFLYPTLIGAFTLHSSRGDAIERYWDQNVGLENLSLGQLALAWHDAYAAAAHAGSTPVRPPFPMPMFNACTLDGHAAVITPLDSAVYLDRFDDAARYRALRDEYHVGESEELTWVHDRDAVYPLESLSAKANPTLSEAVRASANFPFGFPLVDVRTDREYGPLWVKKRKKLVSLTDGGVLSNSGLWTLFHLLTHERSQAELKRRGVLLIVVDANMMPVYSPDRRNFASLYGAIKDQDPVAQNLHRKMFDLLFQEYEDAIEIVKVDLIPSVHDNVHTTWALDQKSRDKLRRSFERVWSETDAKAHVHDKIKTAWDALTARARAAQQLAQAMPATGSAKRRASAASMLRPPLD